MSKNRYESIIFSMEVFMYLSLYAAIAILDKFGVIPHNVAPMLVTLWWQVLALCCVIAFVNYIVLRIRGKRDAKQQKK